MCCSLNIDEAAMAREAGITRAAQQQVQRLQVQLLSTTGRDEGDTGIENDPGSNVVRALHR